MLKLLLLAAVVGQTQIQTVRDGSLFTPTGKATGGVVINDLALTSARYTPWLAVRAVDDVHFLVSVTYAATTSISAVCWSSMSDTTADGAGFKIPEWTFTGSSTAPVYSGAQVTWSWPVSASTKFVMTLKNAPGLYVQCLFTGGGTPTASDKLTVTAYGVSP